MVFSRESLGSGKKDKPLLFQIHPSFSGASGYYVREIVLALEPLFQQKCFVNFYFPWGSDSLFNKIFYRQTEKVPETNFGNRWGKLRRIIRVIELVMGYVIVLWHAWRMKPSVVNYSLVDSFPITRFFLWILKYVVGKQCTLIITAHDVIPFEMSVLGKPFGVEAQVQQRIRILSLADIVATHDASSMDQLKALVGEDKRVLQYSHPVFPAHQRLKSSEYIAMRSMLERFRKKSKRVFLYVGHIRKEKGLDTLLDAWRLTHKDIAGHLFVAGGPIAGVDVHVDRYNGIESLSFILRPLSDDELYAMVDEADFVVLPYKRTTNSGVLHLVAARRALPVVSRLEPLLSSGLCFMDLAFNPGDAKSLAETLMRCAEMTDEALQEYQKALEGMVQQKRRVFLREIQYAYTSAVVSMVASKEEICSLSSNDV
jgi:glycosyltransferase involved in cell wall biosynthesis